MEGEMKYKWFKDEVPNSWVYRIYRLSMDPPRGEMWNQELRCWVYAEKPVRELFLGPDYLDEITIDEARALLPSEAMPDWRGQIVFKLFSFEIVRSKREREYHWLVPMYEAKDPNPEPVHAVRVRKPITKFSIWQSWDRASQRWRVDLEASRTRHYRGCRLYFIGEALIRDLLPHRAFADLPQWNYRCQQSSVTRFSGRLVSKWKSKTPPSK